MEQPSADRMLTCRMTPFERHLLQAVAARRQQTVSGVVRDAVMQVVRKELGVSERLGVETRHSETMP